MAQIFGRSEIYRPDHDDKPYYFGLSLGFGNYYLNHGKATEFLSTDSLLTATPGFSYGFSLGLLATLHPFEHFEFRANPQLILGLNRSFNYKLSKPAAGEQEFETKAIQSTLASFPFAVKFNSDRIRNFKMYMLAGFQFDLDLASNAAAKNVEGLIKLNKFDYGVHYGLGFNFYLPFVTVSPEIKFVNGLSDLHSRNPSLKFSNVLDQLRSKQLVLSIILEE